MTTATGTAQVTRRFAEAYGRAPQGVWSAPGRVNLIGEHTDYNDGLVLPFGIDRRTWAAVGWRDDRQIRVRSTFSAEEVTADLDALEPGAMEGWSAYVLGIAWALAAGGADLSDARGLDIMIDSDVPVGAGLSSSAALECAVALAMDHLWDLHTAALDLARAGQLAENTAAGAPTGLLDQAASMLAQPDHAVFLDCRSEEVTPVPLHLNDHGLTILVIDSQVAHDHATGGYGDRRRACERGAAALGAASLRDITAADLPRAQQVLDDETYRRVCHVVTENDRVSATVAALAAGDHATVGQLMNASHASMRDDFEITVAEIDLAAHTAVTAGALGARMTGGGFGGSTIALCPADAVASISAAVTSALAEAGMQAPHVFTVVPSQGARREVG